METLKLLVVDDDVDLCNNLKAFFERESYQVGVAHDGPTAIEELGRTHPHLVFLDIGLPGLSGIEVLKQIKLKDPSVRVIMITGQAEEELQRQARVLGADDYVTKPFAAGYLRTEVLEKLQRHLWHELRATSSELLMEKAKLEVVFGQMQEGVLLIDPQGLIITANPSGQRLLGLPAEASGLNIQKAAEAFLTSGQTSVLDSFKALNGKPFEWVREKPKKLILAASATAIKSPQNEFWGYIVVARDVTQERLTEAAQYNFVSFMSHKLRTPLVFIRSFPNLSRQGLFGPLDKNQKEFIDTLEEKACQMEDMVNQLLAFISLGSEQLTRAPVSMTEIIREAVRRLPPYASDKKSKIKQGNNLDQLVLDVDRTLFAYAVRNIIENAFKFGAKTLAISGEERKETVEIEFRDDGPGIPPEELDKVFAPFYQVESDFTGQVTGPGLGLTIVKQVVEAHGGKVWVESQIKKGTAFFIQLPQVAK